MSWSLSQKESQSSLDLALNECGLVELAFCFDVEENHGAEQVRGETKRKAESLSRAAHFAERLFEAFGSGGFCYKQLGHTVGECVVNGCVGLAMVLMPAMQ